MLHELNNISIIILIKYLVNRNIDEIQKCLPFFMNELLKKY